jgi:hypothetical protein
MPAFVRAFGIPLDYLVIISLVSFVCGLISALVAGMFGFFAMSYRATEHLIKALAEEHRAWSMVAFIFQDLTHSKTEAQKQEQKEGEASGYQGHYLKCRLGAIVTVVLAIILFILGALFGALSLSKQPVTASKSVSSQEIAVSGETSPPFSIWTSHSDLSYELPDVSDLP